MKLDTHVHTFHSGYSTIRSLHFFVRECYNTPEAVYRVAKARGMDLVVVTDHDEISGALALGDRPDVIAGSEVTGVFRRGRREGASQCVWPRSRRSTARFSGCATTCGS